MNQNRAYHFINWIAPNTRALLAAWAVASVQASAQGAFLNLDFEAATIPPSAPSTVSLAAALPHWGGRLGTNDVGWAYYNNLSLSGAGITLYGPDFPDPYATMHGQYFVQLKAGMDPFGSSALVEAAIAQMGTVPVQAHSIRLWSLSSSVLSFAVRFNGQEIAMSNLGRSPSPGYPSYIWGGDISAFAGQFGELCFQGSGYLDYIQFSAIPEPSPIAVAGLGAVILALHRHRRPRT